MAYLRPDVTLCSRSTLSSTTHICYSFSSWELIMGSACRVSRFHSTGLQGRQRECFCSCRSGLIRPFMVSCLICCMLLLTRIKGFSPVLAELWLLICPEWIVMCTRRAKCQGFYQRRNARTGTRFCSCRLVVNVTSSSISINRCMRAFVCVYRCSDLLRMLASFRYSPAIAARQLSMKGLSNSDHI